MNKWTLRYEPPMKDDTPVTNRVWQKRLDGPLYLADGSGDGYRGEPGKPDETDDGPLKVQVSYGDPIVIGSVNPDRPWAAKLNVRVPVVTPSGKRASCYTNIYGLHAMLHHSATPLYVRLHKEVDVLQRVLMMASVVE